jgi:hypothetical protein
MFSEMKVEGWKLVESSFCLSNFNRPLRRPLGFELLFIYKKELSLVETVENAKRYPRAEPG